MGSVVPGPPGCAPRGAETPGRAAGGPTMFNQGSPREPDLLLPFWERTRPACRHPLSWPRPSQPAGLPWGEEGVSSSSKGPQDLPCLQLTDH